MAPAKKGGEANTVLDGLHQMYADAAQLALASDAGQYPQIVQALPQALLKAIQAVAQQKAQMAAQQHQQMAQQAAQMGGGGPPGAPPGMPGAGGPPGMPLQALKGQPGGPPSQGSPGIAMPNPDELRRVLASQGAGG